MKIKIEFIPTRELTPLETSNLLDSLYLQVVEPIDKEGNEETWGASFVSVSLAEGN